METAVYLESCFVFATLVCGNRAEPPMRNFGPGVKTFPRPGSCQWSVAKRSRPALGEAKAHRPLPPPGLAAARVDQVLPGAQRWHMPFWSYQVGAAEGAQLKAKKVCQERLCQRVNKTPAGLGGLMAESGAG